jgi:hypothetical protein
MSPRPRIKGADFWAGLRYSLAVVGGVIMLFAVPKAIRYLYADPLVALFVLIGAAGFCVSIRHVR